MSQATKAVQHCTNMTDVRRCVDALDDVLVPLLVQRTAYMTQAARIKQDACQVRDEARIQAIVDRVRRQALHEGGEPAVIEATRVPPSAWMTSQSMMICFSPRARRSVTARRERPMSRWIS